MVDDISSLNISSSNPVNLFSMCSGKETFLREINFESTFLPNTKKFILCELNKSNLSRHA